MKKILYIVSALLLLVSCVKDLDPLDSGLTTPIGDYKISVSANADTKVDIDGTVVKWAEGDYIYVAEVGDDEKFNELHTFYIDSESISEDGKSADFYGETLESGKQYLTVKSGTVFIPQDTIISGTEGSLFLTSSFGYQYGDGSDFHVEASWTMLSQIYEVEEDSTPQIQLSNISSYFDLNLTMEDDVDDEYTITIVAFTAPQPMFRSQLYLNSSSEIIHSVTTNKLTLTLYDEPTISSKSDYTAYLPFISNDDITEIDGDFTITIYTSDYKESSVTVTAKLLTENMVYTKELEFPEPVDMVASDRAALIDFYNATDGDNWTNSDNWCTDASLDEWYGVTIDDYGRVVNLSLVNNNLNGSIPESIGNLENIQSLELFDDGITGAIPESIGNLVNLVNLYITCYNLSGSLPESMGNLVNLKYLAIISDNLTGSIPDSFSKLVNLTYFDISGSTYEWPTGIAYGTGQLSGEIPDIFGDMYQLASIRIMCQQFTGTIPNSICESQSLTYLNLFCNQLDGSVDFLLNIQNLLDFDISINNFSGVIPEEFGNRSDWSEIAWDIITTQREGYGFTSFPDVYLEPSTVTTIENKTINTEEFFGYNELTCVLLWRSWCWYSTYYLETLKDMYNSYASKGFGLITLNDEKDLSTITTYVSENSIPGHVCQLSSENWTDYSDGSNRIKYMPTSSSPTFAFVDSDGKIVFCETLYSFDDPSMSREEATTAFLEEYFGEPATSTDDESTDYSMDGEVVTLQTATVGDGINLVIVGDGFIDTDMESGGVYETRMSEAMEHFFSEEPYATYRDRYNVYAIKAVSKNSGVNGVSETAFSSQFGDGTFIWGDDTKVFEYALKVPSITTTDNLTVIAVLNSSTYAGTCYMYEENDAAIAYCPIVSYNDEQFRQVITHEAGGHGFAKLLDEYAYTGTITQEDIEIFEEERSFGWGANVDVTSDRSEIQWAHMLSDSRYDGLVDVYEGALTYAYGAYRPTDVSIMRYNTGGYNPPSREEIYRRIMVLSGGTFDYEEFVTYDAINRTASAQRQAVSQVYQVDKSKFVPLTKPVVVMGSPKVSK